MEIHLIKNTTASRVWHLILISIISRSIQISFNIATYFNNLAINLIVTVSPSFRKKRILTHLWQTPYHYRLHHLSVQQNPQKYEGCKDLWVEIGAEGEVELICIKLAGHYLSPRHTFGLWRNPTSNPIRGDPYTFQWRSQQTTCNKQPTPNLFPIQSITSFRKEFNCSCCRLFVLWPLHWSKT